MPFYKHVKVLPVDSAFAKASQTFLHAFFMGVAELQQVGIFGFPNAWLWDSCFRRKGRDGEREAIHMDCRVRPCGLPRNDDKMQDEADT